MKKSILVIMLLVAFAVTAFAGGLLTNTNQSSQFVRMLSRNASTQIDAVYFNPAGLVKLEDGWHFAIHNQSIFQEKSVNSMFPLLNDGKYIGKVKAPVFPSAFAVYKMDKWAFSLGFGPNGGGGSADFERGLPSFEIPITKLGAGLKRIAPLVTPYQIPAATGYDASLSFEGSSVFWGIQVGASYKLGEMISISGGVRYLPATNTYKGEISNIQVATGSSKLPASGYISTITPVLNGTINALNTAATSLQAAITAGLLDPNAALTNPAVTPYLPLLGVTSTTNQGAVTLMNKTKASLETLKNANVADRKVDTKQTGAGWTPIIGINITPMENLDIAIKYEHKTTLELVNSTTVDNLGLFPDKGKSRSDIPAILAVGIGYTPADWLEAQVSYNLYFDKNVDWGYNTRDLAIYKELDPTKIRPREIDKNYYELALGLQFNLSEKFALSVGALTSQPGVADSYQSDFSYSNPSYTLAGGIQWKVTERLALDAGLMNTVYKDAELTFTDPDVGNYAETLGKTTMGFAFGLSYSIFK